MLLQAAHFGLIAITWRSETDRHSSDFMRKRRADLRRIWILCLRMLKFASGLNQQNEDLFEISNPPSPPTDFFPTISQAVFKHFLCDRKTIQNQNVGFFPDRKFKKIHEPKNSPKDVFLPTLSICSLALKNNTKQRHDLGTGS